MASSGNVSYSNRNVIVPLHHVIQFTSPDIISFWPQTLPCGEVSSSIKVSNWGLSVPFLAYHTDVNRSIDKSALIGKPSFCFVCNSRMTQNTAVSKRLILHCEIVWEETETIIRQPMNFLREQKALLCTFCIMLCRSILWYLWPS